MNDLDAEARRILRLARAARSPSSDDKARVARRIALASAAAGGVAASAGSAKAAKLSVLLSGAKVWIASGVLLSAAVGGYLGFQPGAAPPPAARLQQPTFALSAPVPAPAPPPAAATEPPAVAPAPRRAARQTTATSAEEVELLHHAQRAWRTHDALHALDLVRTHRQRYPHSQLRSERDVLEVLARCEQSHDARSLQLAKRLLAREPQSPSRAAIEQSCGF